MTHRSAYSSQICFLVLLFAQTSVNANATEPFADGFESGQISKELWQKDIGENCTIDMVEEPVRTGKFAAQFVASNKTRCELVPHTIRGNFAELKRKLFREPFQKDRWYRFSTYLRAPWVRHEKNEVLAQWHASPDPIIASEKGRGPPLALRVIDNFFRISYGWDARFRSSEKNIAKYTLWYDTVQTDTWIDWIFRVRWSYEKDGLIQIWKNGELIVDYRGPNAYNDLRGVYLKIGVYHPRPERTVIFDDIYVDDVAPPSFDRKKIR